MSGLIERDLIDGLIERDDIDRLMERDDTNGERGYQIRGKNKVLAG